MRVVFSTGAFPEDFHPSEELDDLLLKGVEIGLERWSSEGTLLPMLIIDTPDGYDLVIIEADNEQSLRDSATARLANAPAVSRYALLFEGGIIVQDVEIDVVVVEGAESGMLHAYRLLGLTGEEPGCVYHGHADQLLPPAGRGAT